jgi:guanine nucleotide-binding protein subunit alpha
MYRQHLEPLVELEERLTRLLSCPDEDEPTRLPPVDWQSQSQGKIEAKMWSKGRPAPTIYIPQKQQSYPSPVSPTTTSSSSQGTLHSPITSNSKLKKKKEMAVHTTTNWKKAFSLGGKEQSPKSAHSGEIEGWWEDPDDPVHALNACASAMLQLWRDPNVKERLMEKRLRLEESSGLFVPPSFLPTLRFGLLNDAAHVQLSRRDPAHNSQEVYTY